VSPAFHTHVMQVLVFVTMAVAGAAAAGGGWAAAREPAERVHALERSYLGTRLERPTQCSLPLAAGEPKIIFLDEVPIPRAER
jgi:hypothetical protein